MGLRRRSLGSSLAHVLFALCVIAAPAGSGCNNGSENRPEEASGEASEQDSVAREVRLLSQLFGTMPVWCKGLTDVEAARTLDLLETVASYDPDTIREAMKAYVGSSTVRREDPGLCRLYLINLYLFDVPSDSVANRGPGWRSPSAGEEVPLSWPLLFDDSGSASIAPYAGILYSGEVYDPIFHFDELRSAYGLRTRPKVASQPSRAGDP